MAELEAVFVDPKTQLSQRWTKTFPDREAKLTLGRIALSDTTKMPKDRADWSVPEDKEISRVHAELVWNEPILTVTRRDTATNPIFHRKDPAKPAVEIKKGESFRLLPGESFGIGTTQFNFSIEAPLGGTDNHPKLNTDTEMTIPVAELRRNVFHNLHDPLYALQDVPGMIRLVNADDIMIQSLEIVLKGVPRADVAAIVRIDMTDPKARPVELHARQQKHLSKDFIASNQVVRHAIQRNLDSFLYIWNERESKEIHFDQTAAASDTDWVICTPLGKQGKHHIALYVEGSSATPLFKGSGSTSKNAELRDAQKFVDLIAQLYSAAQERGQLERNLNQFSRFLPKRMIQMMNVGTLEEQLEPKLTPVTVLFCDLRGSCGLAEAGQQDLLASWQRIGDTLEIMSSAITERDGIIGDLQGDAVMGFWGWPHYGEAPEVQIEKAVMTALQIRASFEKQIARKKGTYQCGIGLAHGMGVAGKLGVYEQFKIDVFGPVVNLAARLESMTKQFAVDILVDSSITDALEGKRSDQWQFRPLARVCPAGMSFSTMISELRPSNPMSSDHTRQLMDTWKAGVKAFVAKDWPLAQKYFDSYVKRGHIQKDRPLEFLSDYMEKWGTPQEGWDGSIVMDKK